MSVDPALSTDEERLAQLGYQQELHRRLSGFSNFAVSFSIISILAGAITSYGIAMNAGGKINPGTWTRRALREREQGRAPDFSEPLDAKAGGAARRFDSGGERRWIDEALVGDGIGRGGHE